MVTLPLTEDQRALAAQWLPLACKLAWCRYRRLRGAVEIEELESTALLALCQAAAQYDETRGVPFKAWAARVIVQKLSQRIHTYFSPRHLPPVPFSCVADSEHCLPLHDPHELSAETRAVAAEIVEAAGHLPGRQGRLLLKRVLDGMTYAEVAAEEGNFSRQAVHQNVQRAIATLRTRLGADKAG